MHSSHVAPPSPDPYYLRGLLHCRFCGQELRPAFASSGQRLYGCPNEECERPWVSAERVEQQAWTRFAALNEEAAREVPPAARQSALVAVINRITVGWRPEELAYDWRD
ncbi:zinc ribbon domain-containing protein [Micromonospora sp. NPDC049559]|uniref:zinc ribbon domain-containing protein n=1 Tax=Micromonospora sp. NPDC049559 TaxID=3155923 RepID=UPI00343C5FE7